VRLLQNFPSQGIRQADVDEFNNQTWSEIEFIRDFIILHYKVTERRDTPYWKQAAEMAVPAPLQHRIDMFQQTGRAFRVTNELFGENSWIQVMLGQGIMPDQHHPSADLMDDEELSAFLESIRTRVERTVAQLPAHQEYVERYCGAKL
jgi:tryptophan halogenase